MKNKEEFVWCDRKRTFLGLPWSFTVYKLTEEKLLIETGFFSKKDRKRQRLGRGLPFSHDEVSIYLISRP